MSFIEWITFGAMTVGAVASYAREYYASAAIIAACAGFVLGVNVARWMFKPPW